MISDITEIRRILKSKKLFLFDMDGTLYIDNEVFDGARELISYIKETGSRALYLTNNSSRSVDSYIKKMRSLCFECDENDFFTSTEATIEYLRSENGINRIYALGTESFRKELLKQGFNVTDCLDDNIDTLLMGFDRELNFGKLEDACILLGRGVRYIATNPDLVCPTSYGFVPDCGSVAQILKNATGREPLFIGKPKPEMALLSMKRENCSSDETVLIGDRIYTDIACGVNAKITSVLVMSGETDEETLKKSNVKPDIKLDNVGSLLKILQN